MLASLMRELVEDFFYPSSARGSRFTPAASRLSIPRAGLEVEADLRRQRSRCDVMRTAEGRKEVVERVFVGDVYAGQSKAPFVLIAIEEVVLADRRIKQASLLNAWRVFVVVLRTGRRDRYQLRSQLRSQALISWYCCEWRGLYAVTRKTGLELLVRSQSAEIDSWLAVDRNRRAAIDRITQTVWIRDVVARH